MRAVFYKRSEERDRFNQAKKIFTQDGEPVPCRVSYAGINASNFRSGEIMSDRTIDLVGETRLIFVPIDTTATEKHMVKVINDNDEEIMPLSTVYSVRPRYDGRAGHHKEVISITFRDSGFKQAEVSA